MAYLKPCISYAEFRQLRLANFVGAEHIYLLEDWKYLGHVWVGEAVGFSEWLRLERTPDVLGSLAIGFSEMEPSVVQRIFRIIGLPLRAGMCTDDLSNLFGEPRREFTFTPDRVTLEYLVGTGDLYTLSCTVKHDGGLVYCTLLSHEIVAIDT